MRPFIVRTLGALLCIGGATSAFAQFNDWDFECIDPATTNPYSNPFLVTGLANDLMFVSFGGGGTVTYGDAGNPDDDVPCFGTTHQIQNRGRFALGIGSQGSIQDQFPADPTSGFIDDFMGLTFGYPTSPGGSSCYASTVVDGTRTRYGQNAVNLLFVGLSNRYLRAESTNDGIRTQLTLSVVGDAIQFSWLLTNTTAASHDVGMWFGAAASMFAVNPDVTGNVLSGYNAETPTNSFLSFKDGYVTLSSGGRPPLTEHRYQRAVNPQGFPQTADFLFGQTNAFGFRVENGPTAATQNNSGQSDATEATEFVLGNQFFLLGRIYDENNFPDVIFPPIDPNDPDQGSDVPFLDEPAFIQKFPAIAVAANSSRRITHYIRSPWGNSNYTAPYAAVVDAPQLVAEDNTGADGSENGLRPNPLTVRVYVDNVGGYATVNQEVALSSVRVTLSLSDGLSLAPGEVAAKTIATVAPREVGFVDFSVIADGIAYGDLPYSVKIEPVPGPTKILNGSIRVAATPRLNLVADANLVTVPWTFSDTSWETILSPLTAPGDFQAFKWDPEQQGYVISTSAERGTGVWIVTDADLGSLQLGGNPQRPVDTATGGKTIQLKGGWNIIGNPYNYAIRVGELVGVSAAAPDQAYTWQQLVNQGLVSGALVYYDPVLQDYVFTQGLDALIQPNRGYWLFVATQQDLTLSFPAVFAPFLPGSSRRAEDRWVQNDRQWRLKIAARTTNSLDAENYVGQARNAQTAAQLRFAEPPITPVHDVQVAIEETVAGKTSRLAQSLSDKTGRKEWKVVVNSTKAGTVHLTWPNLTTVPKNVRFRLTDTSTGTTTDLRKVSGYSFEAKAGTTREFKVEAIPGGVSAVVIGNVVVNKTNTRDALSPFAITYTLSNDATTTVRILSGSGKEVYSVFRGRADKAGENSASWPVRDNANRFVAPGTYRVEIIAETSNGERVRRVVPINVIR